MIDGVYQYNITTFGCQMNKNDSERMAAVLELAGFAPVDDPRAADVLILNTCSVRDSAESRIFGRGRDINKWRAKNPNLVVAITGCLPGRDPKGEVKKKMPWVDLYFPNSEMVRLPAMIAEIRPQMIRQKSIFPDSYLSVIPKYSENFRAFVPVQTGCNQFCTYCVVPYSRGREKNRPLAEILSEVRALAEKGVREVHLLGEIVNHYTAPDPENFSENNLFRKNDFARLLFEINNISGIERIHYTAPHPLYMDEEMIAALALPHHMNYLHLPVQSGSDKILAKMNRRHTRAEYLDIIKKIRQVRPGIAIGTDIIVGFCGETEDDFMDTIRLYEECDFDISYPAQYSVRSGTAAAKVFVDDVSEAEKKTRWNRLQAKMEEITEKKNRAYLGKTVSVLVDRWENGECLGNSSEMKLVGFGGDSKYIGQIVSVRIDFADKWILRGEMI
ncbi:MAG TPA: tRNA (N6-isopentenyl adenosine(37)-C2)-methylthiotransferase MiaB [Candidatus Magasanikbacteria bacterium]|nr:tRNA (N6-isopentenyl adenosine(37)-C2)-methylthiotransferase MiaB [Candidatus Magasanikbacteria bacterium]